MPTITIKGLRQPLQLKDNANPYNQRITPTITIKG